MDNRILKRNSTLELMRILSMILIVSWHFATQFSETGTGVLDSGMSWYHIFAIAIGSWGQLGVDLFIIISVFFLKSKNMFHSSKLIDIIIQTIFYGCLWTVICLLSGIQVGGTEIIKNVFSLFFNTFWFATAYVIMYCFSPVLNEILSKCSGGGGQ